MTREREGRKEDRREEKKMFRGQGREQERRLRKKIGKNRKCWKEEGERI